MGPVLLDRDSICFHNGTTLNNILTIDLLMIPKVDQSQLTVSCPHAIKLTKSETACSIRIYPYRAPKDEAVAAPFILFLRTESKGI